MPPPLMPWKWCMGGGSTHPTWLNIVPFVATTQMKKQTITITTAPTAVQGWMVMGMDKYFVIRNKETGFYFRGKGENRWGKYHNQASVYRMKAQAENTHRWLSRYGEPVEIVPIQIVENPTDIAEVVRCKDCKHWHEETAFCEKHSRFDSFGMDWNMFAEDDFCSYGERKDND